MKILVVDDDRLSLMLMAEALRTDGYDVTEARSATEALELLRRSEPIVLVITDLVMPGMDGLEFLAMIRSDPAFEEIPVVACTSMDPQDWLAKAEGFGVSAYITKPLDVEVMLDHVRRILDAEARPLDDTFRTMKRLKLNAKQYFMFVDQLVEELDAACTAFGSTTEQVDSDKGATTLFGLAGTARNLGVSRIAHMLARQAEQFKKERASSQTAIAAALRRETNILRAAVVMMKQEQSDQARRGGRSYISNDRSSPWRRRPAPAQPPQTAEKPTAKENPAAVPES